MPFGNMDSDKIEARKGLLETFVKVSRFMFYYINLMIVVQYNIVPLFWSQGIVNQRSVFFSNYVPSLK